MPAKTPRCDETVRRLHCYVIAVFISSCVITPLYACNDLSCFADEVQTRIWNDIVSFWDEGSPAEWDALNDRARATIADGLNGMLRGQNLDPGQRWRWECSGVGGLRLDYPRPNFPVVSVDTVSYMKVADLALLAVDWKAEWEGLSHAIHNGPYLYFRITGGYLWSRSRDVRIHIDRMDWTMSGLTWIVVAPDGSLAQKTWLHKPFSSTMSHQLHIAYENPNTYGWRERVGNRIIGELQRNYEDRIARLVYDALFADFIAWRIEEVSRPDDGFWERWGDWVSRQESLGGSFSY